MIKFYTSNSPEDEKYPFIDFSINPSQVILILGVDAEALGGVTKFIDKGGLTTNHAGKLSDQPQAIMDLCMEQMDSEGWDYTICSDPEIFVMTNLADPWLADKLRKPGQNPPLS